MEVKNRKIYSYISNNKLEIEKIINDYTNYIYTIIKNASINFLQEDIEEIILDVFLTVWNNQEKLNINNSISAYIAGITRNLIKKKYREIKINNNIEDYEEELIDLHNIELNFVQNEKNKIVHNELEKLETEDKDIFIEYYYAQRNIREISLMFNITESKVKSKLFRIRKRLKKALKEGGYSYNE